MSIKLLLYNTRWTKNKTEYYVRKSCIRWHSKVFYIYRHVHHV